MIKDDIKAALALRGKTAYWLAKEAARLKVCSYSGVYHYLSGKYDMGSEPAQKLLELANLYHIADMTITGGTYFLTRTNDIEIRIDVTQNWEPTNLPLSFKLFTWFVRSFRNWPTTYIWNGSINLDNITLVGCWSRKN